MKTTIALAVALLTCLVASSAQAERTGTIVSRVLGCDDRGLIIEILGHARGGSKDIAYSLARSGLQSGNCRILQAGAKVRTGFFGDGGGNGLVWVGDSQGLLYVPEESVK